MKECWQRELKRRPDFTKVTQTLEDQVHLWEGEEGTVPTKASEIRAKKRKKKVATDRLDVDTRIATDEDPTSKRHDGEIV